VAARVVIGIVALVGVSACGMLSALASLEMADKVNEKLPKEDQFSPLGWYWAKTRRLHREYNRLNPSGHLSRNRRLLAGLALACLLIFCLELRVLRGMSRSEVAGIPVT
jgi:hypothetical protein